MTVPNVQITKLSGGTAGAVPPSNAGINAIIACSQQGPLNQPGGYSTQNQALTDFGYGPLAEDNAYDIAVSQKSTLLVRSAGSVAGGYSAVTKNITGTAVPTAGATAPLDEYAFVLITIVAGGTIGVAGITYTYSLDGGTSTSGVQALGTATTLAIPNSGVSFTLTGAQTFIAGDSFSCYTTRPQPSNSDLVASLEALRTTQNIWENVLVDTDATSTTVNTVDVWLAGLEAVGQFHAAFLNSRHKLVPVPGTETESAFAAAMTTAFSAVSSFRLLVGADAGDLPSQLTGIVQPRPVALAVAARCALIPLGEDPAFVSRGNIPGFGISDGKGNPKWHDEQLFPGIDPLRLTAFRTIPGEQGVYINNANLLSPSGSAFVYMQHARCMNRACTIAFASLTQQLSRGVGKKAPDPVTGAVYILEQDAQMIETLATTAMRKDLQGQVVDVVLQLHRNDDLSTNAGATINGDVEVEDLAYIKKFQINAAFTKAISVQV